jgi:hypothetical protein
VELPLENAKVTSCGGIEALPVAFADDCPMDSVAPLQSKNSATVRPMAMNGSRQAPEEPARRRCLETFCLPTVIRPYPDQWSPSDVLIGQVVKTRESKKKVAVFAEFSSPQ